MLVHSPLVLLAFASVALTSAFTPGGLQAWSVDRASSTVLFDKKGGKKTQPKKRQSSGSTKGFGAALKDLRSNSFPYAGAIRPGKQSPQKVVVDASIMKPDYADDGIVSVSSNLCCLNYLCNKNILLLYRNFLQMNSLKRNLHCFLGLLK